ncbi:MAG: NAD-binding protein [Myxococcales bacterium]|nr:NAD-binding protein [Myxococcales bacterium]
MIRFLISLLVRFRRTSGEALPRVTLLSLTLMFYATSGFMYFELEGAPDLQWTDAFWWAIVTMTTVGYGDLFPKTFGGRYLVAVPTMLFGISILGYLLSMVAAFLIEERNRELKGMADVKLDGHLLIIHFPNLQRVLEVEEQFRHDDKTRGKGLVLIDPDLEELPPELVERGVRFVRGNPVLEETLRMASAQSASQAIILAKVPHDRSTDNTSLAVTLTLEHIWPDLHTVAECVDPANIQLLERCGCDSVVCMDELASQLLVQEALDPGVKALVHEITSNTYGQEFYTVPTPGATWNECQHKLVEIGALPLGLRRDGKVMINPPGSEAIRPGDMALCIAPERPVI